MLGIDAMHPLGRLHLVLGCGESMRYMNTLDDQYAILCAFHLAGDLGRQLSIAGIDFTHFQCVAKCADQSTADRRHQIINRSGMRLH
jgi:hypothetical protein